jgi:serine/threonine protein kinase
MDGFSLNMSRCLFCLVFPVEILRALDHPHIVKAIETFDYHGQLCLVLELCSGGDLYARGKSDLPSWFYQLFAHVVYGERLHLDVPFLNSVLTVTRTVLL